MKARRRARSVLASRQHPIAIRFRVAAATAQGRRHEAEGVACQDAVARIINGRFAAIVLCDGAGSALHAARGARTTADATARHLLKNFEALITGAEQRAKRSILDHVQSALRRVSHKHSSQLADLACTLLFAATDGTTLLIGQIGDGRVGVRDADTGQWRPLLTACKGEFLNETTFVTSGRSGANFQLARGPASKFSACVLMSDGAEEGLFNRATQTLAPAVETIADWVVSHPKAKVESALSLQLQATLRTKTFDDVALACMSSLKCAPKS